MQVARVHQLNIVAEIIIALLGREAFYSGSQLIGGTVAGDLVDEVFERDVRILL
jgi:hypothetical protein